jgi:hypothetical protein
MEPPASRSLRRPVLATLGGVVALILLRLLVSQALSMKAIGEARAVVYDRPAPSGDEMTDTVAIAEAVEGALHQAHDAWLYTGLALDALILIVVLRGTLSIARAGRAPDPA